MSGIGEQWNWIFPALSGTLYSFIPDILALDVAPKKK